MMFALIGSAGFCVDGGILTLLSRIMEIDIYLSRIASFTTATITTWLLNRRFTFQADDVSVSHKQQEYFRYLTVQIGGSLLNMGIFSLLIFSYPALRGIPIAPLAVGALFGLIFNYNGCRFWVYPTEVD